MRDNSNKYERKNNYEEKKSLAGRDMVVKKEK